MKWESNPQKNCHPGFRLVNSSEVDVGWQGFQNNMSFVSLRLIDIFRKLFLIQSGSKFINISLNIINF